MKKLKYLVPLICFVGLSIFLLYRVVNYFPDYQNEARVWFDQEMNLDLNFSSSRISWGILGPIVVFENATITTNGTGDLTLNTNSGTDSGFIEIRDGNNANITVDTAGNGDILLKTDGSAGRLGIGTVGNPDTAVHVKSAASIVTLQN